MARTTPVIVSRPTNEKVIIFLTACDCCAATVTPFTSSGATYPAFAISALKMLVDTPMVATARILYIDIATPSERTPLFHSR